MAEQSAGSGKWWIIVGVTIVVASLVITALVLTGTIRVPTNDTTTHAPDGLKKKDEEEVNVKVEPKAAVTQSKTPEPPATAKVLKPSVRQLLSEITTPSHSPRATSLSIGEHLLPVIPSPKPLAEENESVSSEMLDDVPDLLMLPRQPMSMPSIQSQTYASHLVFLDEPALKASIRDSAIVSDTCKSWTMDLKSTGKGSFSDVLYQGHISAISKVLNTLAGNVLLLYPPFVFEDPERVMSEMNRVDAQLGARWDVVAFQQYGPASAWHELGDLELLRLTDTSVRLNSILIRRDYVVTLLVHWIQCYRQEKPFTVPETCLVIGFPVPLFVDTLTFTESAKESVHSILFILSHTNDIMAAELSRHFAKGHRLTLEHVAEPIVDACLAHHALDQYDVVYLLDCEKVSHVEWLTRSRESLIQSELDVVALENHSFFGASTSLMQELCIYIKDDPLALGRFNPRLLSIL